VEAVAEKGMVVGDETSQISVASGSLVSKTEILTYARCETGMNGDLLECPNTSLVEARISMPRWVEDYR